MDIITEIEKLSDRADEIDPTHDNELVRSITVALKNTIRDTGETALTAPQIGHNKRIFVINFNGNLRTFVNPIITGVEGFELATETCASLPGKKFIRPRHSSVTLMYQTPLGKIESKQFIGAAAKVAQHCLDHLEGVLLSDIGLEIDEDFEKASEEEKYEVIKMYLDSLDIAEKTIKEEIAQDGDLKQISDAIDFMTAVKKNEVTLAPDDMIKEETVDGYEHTEHSTT